MRITTPAMAGQSVVRPAVLLSIVEWRHRQWRIYASSLPPPQTSVWPASVMFTFIRQTVRKPKTDSDRQKDSANYLSTTQ